MEHCHKRIGEASFRTPRNTIMGFSNLLAVLEQNPGVGGGSCSARSPWSRTTPHQPGQGAALERHPLQPY